MSSHKITQIVSRMILDSRGFPTVEVDLCLDHTFLGRASVPSGASTGTAEALELRDQDPQKFLGKGVQKSLDLIHSQLWPAVSGKTFVTQQDWDMFLIQQDGTASKKKWGANTLLALSLAFLKAQAKAHAQPLFSWIQASAPFPCTPCLPIPLMNFLNGGKHADNGLSIQEFLVLPAQFPSFQEALRAGVEIFHHLKKLLNQKRLSTSVGDEGGFAPRFSSSSPHVEALDCLMEAIRQSGYRPGQEVYLGLDVAASEFWQADTQSYLFEGKRCHSSELIERYAQWTKDYPLLSIEDGLAEHDWAGWNTLTEQLGNQCQLVGDDLFVTQGSFLTRGSQEKVANAILIKPNQVGTLTETYQTMALAHALGYRCIPSHRSGETEDTAIADWSLGTGCGQIKTGAASRTDRTSKYNQLLRREQEAFLAGKPLPFAGNPSAMTSPLKIWLERT